ncbi:thiol:disulfide interchange protein DsbD [Crenobacter luteus]|uniref:protein-disulfide reductase DsbD n=1 Tax=Crenobacter luteus TaxID=1452487 RepID=UPI00104C7D7A|nr:protein-disulfide reductase DsbD [Crenobacter luteus]TCP14619.1 thiol:disulfide interchange protein DsbD [Crenobacter luteus]
MTALLSILTRRLALLLALACLLPAPARAAVDADELLPPEKAFPITAVRDGDTVKVTVGVSPGYYLYRDRSRFESAPPGLLAGAPRFPEGKEKQDPFFGKQVVYTRTAEFVLPLAPGAPERFALTVTVQGCAEVGVCYPPYTSTLTVGGKGGVLDWLGGTGTATPPPANAPPTLLGDGGRLLTLGAFWLAGLGMAFTACMYPLLPILSSLIAGQGQALTRRRGLALAFAYVQGMALSYTAVGVLAGLTGSLLTVWLQQPAVVLSAAGLMVALALSMFGLFNLQLPSALQTRLAERSNRLPGGRFVTVFLMGVLSALIVGPCVAPPLALALGYIGRTGDALLGGATLYAMALGLGTPLLLLGAFGGEVLPRAGAWMKGVKAAFGVVMLGVALWMATPFLPGMAVMLGWAALAIGSAVFLRAFDALPSNAGAPQRLLKALGLVLFLVGAAQLVGALSGRHEPGTPLKGLFGAEARAVEALPFQPIDDVAALDAALAASAGKPVLLDFYADWCVACKELEAGTFTDPAVAAAMRRYTLLRADVTANKAAHQALMKRFGLFGPPGLILFDPQGREADRVIGFVEADAFLPRLTTLLAR